MSGGPWAHDGLQQKLPKFQRFRPAAGQNFTLTLLVGQYAQARYLAGRQKASLTETVESFRDYLPEQLPLPHPSWRSKIWMKKNPWFGRLLLPELRRRVAAALRSGATSSRSRCFLHG